MERERREREGRTGGEEHVRKEEELGGEARSGMENEGGMGEERELRDRKWNASYLEWKRMMLEMM